ncbi:MAG: (d)CMP kinase [Chthoniobacterales bacterium]|nr:(d)CMP kinase [Chthoniobacterales bacterium]
MDARDSTVVIAMDGPAASGKSTVARELARRLGYRFFNSGDLYRAMTRGCLRQGVDCRDARAVALASENVQIDIAADDHQYFPIITGEDARPYLRGENVNANVSHVSAVPEVRSVITDTIRKHAQGRQTVIEGRDIGSAVFPETPFKFYIDASPEVRQQRRRNEGQTEEIARRDSIDSTRSTAPLSVAPGAVVIDTSDLAVAGVVAAILGKLREMGLPAASALCSNE